jgi:hypothetical protein
MQLMQLVSAVSYVAILFLSFVVALCGAEVHGGNVCVAPEPSMCVTISSPS